MEDVRLNFIQTIAPIVLAFCKEKNYRFPSAIIAQACLESNYGKSKLAQYFNYFGLKCGSKWTGKSVNLITKEEYNGNTAIIKDNFRVFENMEDGVKGYFSFIASSRYDNLRTATGPVNYLQLIKEDGYATASNYVNAVSAVIDAYNLTKYDFKKDESKKEITPDIIADVISGKYGCGAIRQMSLASKGYSYEDVQLKVNIAIKFIENLKGLKNLFHSENFWFYIKVMELIENEK